MAATTKVYYFIAEDGDEEAHPNVFSIPKPARQVGLGDVVAHFPLKQHPYHFRFKRAFQTKYVWLDVLSESQPLPQFEGALVCKVTRLGEASASFPAQAAAAPKATTTATKTATTTTTTQPPKKQAEASREPLFEWTEEEEDAPVSKPTPPSTNNQDLFDIFSNTPPPQAASATLPTTKNSSGGLMDFEWAPPPPKPGGTTKILSTVEAAKNFQL
ncbi:hypothetical protein BASA81_006855 [Batrachochytrium salamandrivorans]|nr:hypothetical protein BASA81_006855 [Batrachochytrium salamandrivorans]